MVVKPNRKRQVIGEASKTCHSRMRVSIDDRTVSKDWGYAFRCTDGTGISVGYSTGTLIEGNRVIEDNLVPTPAIKAKYQLGDFVKRNPQKGNIISQQTWDEGYTDNWQQGSAIIIRGASHLRFEDLILEYGTSNGFYVIAGAGLARLSRTWKYAALVLLAIFFLMPSHEEERAFNWGQHGNGQNAPQGEQAHQDHEGGHGTLDGEFGQGHALPSSSLASTREGTRA